MKVSIPSEAVKFGKTSPSPLQWNNKDRDSVSIQMLQIKQSERAFRKIRTRFAPFRAWFNDVWCRIDRTERMDELFESELGEGKGLMATVQMQL